MCFIPKHDYTTNAKYNLSAESRTVHSQRREQLSIAFKSTISLGVLWYWVLVWVKFCKSNERIAVYLYNRALW